MTALGNSPNIFWHECPVGKLDRQKLLNQRGCVVWITGLSGSGKSTLACSLGRELHSRGKLSYILDGDNLRHGLNKDLGFKAEDRAENIRRVGEVAKLFSDAGLICIASLISPYRKDRDACRAMLEDGSFVEVFMNMPLEVCEQRDAKGLYKLARAGKIKGFTGIDDPYEPPLKSEIELKLENGICAAPSAMAGQVASYLENQGFKRPALSPSPPCSPSPAIFQSESLSMDDPNAFSSLGLCRTPDTKSKHENIEPSLERKQKQLSGN
ncbi:hypothetical protein Droror1_Dr00017158 [Drosera rotundifolia]